MIEPSTEMQALDALLNAGFEITLRKKPDGQVIVNALRGGDDHEFAFAAGVFDGDSLMSVIRAQKIN